MRPAMGRGFSLIELLVVIVLVAVLAGIVLVNAQFVMNWIWDLLGHP